MSHTHNLPLYPPTYATLEFPNTNQQLDCGIWTQFNPFHKGASFEEENIVLIDLE
jgi:hypothetical protein